MREVLEKLYKLKKEGKAFGYITTKDKLKTLKKLREMGYICDLYPFGDIIVKL